MKTGLLYVHENQTLICTSQGTTAINVGTLDYMCTKMLIKLVEEGILNPIAEEPVDTFEFNEDDENIVQRYLGSKSELFDTQFVAAMT